MSRHDLFDGSSAHLLPRGILECAAYLRQYNEWLRGDPEDNCEVEMPHPRELGLNIEFAIEVMNAIAGHDHLMVIAGARYCLGRKTTIVGECASWLIKTWPLLNQKTQSILQRDIEEAFARDDNDRAAGREHKALGHDCDRKEWERVRTLWEITK